MIKNQIPPVISRQITSLHVVIIIPKIQFNYVQHSIFGNFCFTLWCAQVVVFKEHNMDVIQISTWTMFIELISTTNLV